MRRFSFLIAAAVFLLAALPGFASNVSFVVGETGLPPGASHAPASTRWESGFLNAFFDAGHIVTNAPIARLSSAGSGLPQECRTDLAEARAGGMEFMVLVILDYSGATVTASDGRVENVPGSAQMRVFRVEPFQLVATERYAARGEPVSASDDAANALSAARLVLPHVRRN